jgi:hypothetical protein
MSREGADTRETHRTPPGGAGPGPAGYDGPGGWSTAAMAVLLGLFVLAVAATAHSMLATLGG